MVEEVEVKVKVEVEEVVEVVVLLVEAGASTTAPDLVQFSALHYAAWWGRLEVAEYLLGREGGTSLLSCLSCVGDTPLHLAVWRGHLTMCGMFLSVAGEVNVQDGEHHSPVHVAAYCGHQEILSLLAILLGPIGDTGQTQSITRLAGEFDVH